MIGAGVVVGGIVVAPPPVVVRPYLPRIHECNICGKSYPTLQELMSHRHAQHKLKNAIRAHVDSTFCFACLTECFHRYKLIDHITNGLQSEYCTHYYRELVPPIDDALFKKLEYEELIHSRALKSQGRHPKYHPIRVFRLPGPLPYNYV